MIDLFFALIAISAASNPPEPKDQAAPLPTEQFQKGNTVIIGEGVSVGAATLIEGAPTLKVSSSDFDTSVVPKGLIADPQVPTGKFTTAAEIKPILTATKGNWVALRDYGGNDLVYVSHLWAWRCGLSAMAIAINDGPMQNMPLPACHPDYASPNVILESDGFPYRTYEQGSVQRITVQIVYDDLSTDVASFEANEIRIP